MTEPPRSPQEKSDPAGKDEAAQDIPAELRQLVDERMQDLRNENEALRRENACLKQRDSERKRAEAALRESEERLRLALDAADAGMWEWDLATNRNEWSERLWSLYGLQPHSCEPSYESWLATIHPDDRDRIERLVQEAARNGLELNIEYRIPDDRGSIRWLMSRGRPLLDTSRKPVRYIGIIMDITERKQAEEALRRRTEDLIRLNQEVEAARDEANTYVDIMTHDVRNANNVSSMYADLLVELLAGDQWLYARKLRDSIQRSSEILRNVATIRRLQQESDRLISVNLDAVVREELGNFPGASIRYDSRRVDVLADGLLPVIFTNLIGNAIKFGGPDAEITISIEEQDGEVLISVADTGPGVPDETKAKLFHRFERGVQRGKGEGLGLYICRTLVTRYGGRIWVEDRVPGHPEEGAVFRFTLRKAG